MAIFTSSTPPPSPPNALGVVIAGPSDVGLPPDTSANVVVLEDPVTGYRAYVIGSAHVSSQSGTDIVRVLQAVQPQYVAVELDAGRLKEVIRKVVGEEPTRKLPTTMFQAFKVMYSHQMATAEAVMGLQSKFFAAILGVPYGYDMITATRIALDSGIPLVPIDRAANVTIMRVVSQFQRKRDSPKKSQPPAARGRAAAVQRLMIERAKEAGCEDPEEVFKSFKAVVSAAAGGKDIPLPALAAVRRCGQRVVESYRHESFVHADQILARTAAKIQAATSADATSASAASAEAGEFGGVASLEDVEGKRERESAPMQSVITETMQFEMPPAILQERDLILAHNLRRCTTQGTTVAVVGAGHVPGLIHHWRNALSAEVRETARQYMLPPANSPFDAQKYCPPPPPPSDGDASDSAVDVSITADDASEPTNGLPSLPSVHDAGPSGGTSIRIRPPPLAPFIFGAGLLGLAIYRPRAAAATAVVLTSFAGATQLLVASVLARGGRVVSRLEEASRKLGVAGEGEDGSMIGGSEFMGM